MEIWYLKKAEVLDEILTQEQQELPMLLKKILYFKKSILGSMKIAKIENNKTIAILPTLKDKKTSNIKKIITKLVEENATYVVLDKELKEEIELKNLLYAQNITIFDGRWLFNFLIKESLEYVSGMQHATLAKQNVAVLVNDASQINKETITLLAQNVKALKIVTSHIQQFKQLEQQLYDTLGIMVTLSNNTQKSLSKSNLIINLDFVEEIIQKYNINKKAIIINVNDKVPIHSKRFEGININQYELEIPQDYIELFKEYHLFYSFDTKLVYESFLYQKSPFEKIRAEILESGVKIRQLIGNNGVIDKSEYERCVIFVNSLDKKRIVS